VKTLLAGGSFGRRATPRGDMAIEAANVQNSAIRIIGIPAADQPSRIAPQIEAGACDGLVL
ncbi:MAG: hypothetical protein WBF49_05870, partial [Methyloceanibacter sp.]